MKLSDKLGAFDGVQEHENSNAACVLIASGLASMDKRMANKRNKGISSLSKSCMIVGTLENGEAFSESVEKVLGNTIEKSFGVKGNKRNKKQKNSRKFDNEPMNRILGMKCKDISEGPSLLD